MDDWAPILVTVMEDALLANFAALIISCPSERATHKAPQKVSPAAVVSTALTSCAGII